MNSTNVGVHLLLGPPNAGKLGRVLEWWAQHREAPGFLLAPTRPDARLLAHELVSRFGPVFGDSPVVTFDGFVARLAEDALPLAGAFTRDVVVRELLATYCEGPFAALAGLPGAPAAVGDLLAEIEEAGLEEEAVEAGLGSWEQEGGGLLARDLARLVREYYGRLRAAGYTERRRLFLQALAEASNWRGAVACYGFTSFTPAQRRLLLAIAESNPVLISLLRAGPESADGLFAGERRWWEQRTVQVEELSLEPHAFSSAELERFNRDWLGLQAEEGRFSPAVPSGASAARQLDIGGVRLMVSAGRRNEVELVAAELVRLLRQGFAPGEIAVTSAGLEPYRLLIDQVFSNAGIPYRYCARVDFEDTSIGHALVSGLQGAMHGRRDALFAYLRSPYAPASASEIDRLEVLLHRTGDLDGEAMLRRARRRLPAVMAELEGALGSGSTSRLVPDAMRRLARAALARSSERAGNEALIQDGRAVAALERALMQLADAARTGLVEEHPSAERMLAALRRISVFPGNEEEQGVVQVLPLHRLRARRYSVVFVLGLVEGEFPSVAPVPSLLGLDRKRDANRAAGTGLFPERQDDEDEDLFALAVSRPWQLLYLSARDAEEEGKEVLPSPFYEKVRAVLGRTHPDVSRGLGDLVHQPAGCPSLRDYLRWCAHSRERPASPDLRVKLETLPPWRKPVLISSNALRSELQSRQTFSPSELETYVSCPFRWFLEKAVRLEELERELDGRSYGSLAHDVLRDVYTALKTDGRLPLREQDLPHAYRHLERALQRGLSRLAEWAEPGEIRAIGVEAKQQLTALVEFDAASGSAFVPWTFEYSVGGSEGVPLGGFAVRGRVDRIDAVSAEGPYLVIDYKTGKRVPRRPFAEAGAFQVPLYVSALEAVHGAGCTAGGVYASLGSGEIRGLVLEEYADAVGGWGSSVVSREEFAEEIQAVLDAAREAAAGVRDARVEAAPSSGCPSFCDLAAVCRSGRRPQRW